MFDSHDTTFDRTTLLDAARRTPFVAALSLLAGCLSLLWLSTALGVWPLWLPAGAAAFAVLRWGKAALPGVWLGSFAAFWVLAPFEGQGAGVALGLACNATLSALTLDWLASRRPLSLREKSDTLRFVAIAGLLPALVVAVLNGLLFGLLGINAWNNVPLALLRGCSSEACAGLLGALVAVGFVSPASLRTVALPFGAIALGACLFASSETSWLSAAFPLLLGASSAVGLLLLNRRDAEPAMVKSPPELRVVRDEAEVQRLSALLQERGRTMQANATTWAKREAELQRSLGEERSERDAKLAGLNGQIEEARRQASDLQRRQHEGEQRMIHYQQLENESRQQEASLRQQVQEALGHAAALQRRESEAQGQRAVFEAQLADWQKRARDSEQQLRELQQQRGEAQQRHDQLQESEHQLRQLLQERQAAIARLEAELRQHHDSHAEQQSRFELSLAESQQRQAAIARLEAEIRQHRERSANLESRCEQTLIEAHQDKMQAAQRVAGQVALDFANPLCAVLGTVDLLGRQWDLPDDFRLALSRVRDAGQAATAKLAELQVLHGSASQPLQRIDLSELAKSARVTKRGVRVECVTDQPAWIEGGADELQRLVQHLATNAAEATPAGGVVRVSSGVDGGRAFLRVEDQGAGMDEATRRRCTEPFFTNKAGGHRGFGLAECWAIAERHAGRLDIDSAPGKGTRVTLWLANRADSAMTQRWRSA